MCRFHSIDCGFRYAVVTGANKGIGLETAKMLASKGVKVVLTARNEKRGLEALEKLKEFGLSNLITFHQLDVTDPDSIASLVDFVETQFGRLDVLVRIMKMMIMLNINLNYVSDSSLFNVEEFYEWESSILFTCSVLFNI